MQKNIFYKNFGNTFQEKQGFERSNSKSAYFRKLCTFKGILRGIDKKIILIILYDTDNKSDLNGLKNNLVKPINSTDKDIHIRE